MSERSFDFSVCIKCLIFKRNKNVYNLIHNRMPSTSITVGRVTSVGHYSSCL